MSAKPKRGASRRAFLTSAASFAVGCAIAGPARAAMGPDDKFDLVIKGGEVLDPSQSLRGRRDIGIRYGVVEAVEPDIPEARALRVIDAGGKLVTPGLVDLHCHVYPYGSAIGIPADELVVHQCTTTCVSAGDAGANNFAGFRRFIVAQTRTRLYAFVHIANIGLTPFPLPELYNLDFAQVESCARAVAENADIAIGVKVRMSENVIAKNGAEPLKRAIQACDMAGTGGRVMAHIGGVENAALMVEVLDLLRRPEVGRPVDYICSLDWGLYELDRAEFLSQVRPYWSRPGTPRYSWTIKEMCDAHMAGNFPLAPDNNVVQVRASMQFGFREDEFVLIG